jgi:transketolase
MRKEIARKILETSFENKEGHIASAFSILDAMIALFFSVMTDQDQFVLSKGHASLALYGVLLEKGEITEEEFYSFCQKDSKLGGHPSSKKLPQVLISTGSLGHGLPFCVGLALSKKIKNEKGTIYCIIGDGEANEGTTWESALAASSYNLDNLVCIMDHNLSGERAIKIGQAYDKFNSFGWKTSICPFGNDSKLIADEINKLKEYEKPKFIQLNTVKGFGCLTLENNPEWHHKQPNSKEQLQQLINELK